MDEANGSGLTPDPADDHSAVMTMLRSDAWQKRLDEAREARERILAERGTKPAVRMPRNPYLSAANPPDLPPLVLEKAEAAPESDEDEEFPEFDAEEENAAPTPPSLAEAAALAVVPLAPLAPTPPPVRPWAHVRPLGPARAVEPPHVPPPMAAAPELAPLRRPSRIATGFGVGLAAGIGMTSLIWALGMTGAPQPAAPAPPAASVAAEPVRAPEPVEVRPAPQVVAQVVPVSVTPPQPLSPEPPVAASALPGAGGLAAMQADAPDVLKIRAIASLSAMLLPPAPLAAAALPDRSHAPITAPAPLPVALSAPPPLGAAEPLEPAARLPDPLLREQPGTAAPVPDIAGQDTPPAPMAPPAPPAPLAEGPAPLPPHRVVVMAPTSIPEDALASSLARLAEEGFALETPDRVAYTVKADHVRYYHPQDRDVAVALAASIGGEARDFTASDRDPPTGTIELFLQGSAPKPARVAKPKRTRPAAQAQVQAPQPPREDPQLRQLRDRIVRQLQRGDHL